MHEFNHFNQKPVNSIKKVASKTLLRAKTHMMPFSNRNKEGAASMPVETIKVGQSEGMGDPLHIAAADLYSALMKGDIKDIAEALKAAFILCDSEPHQEGDHY